jgi:hypothetical protein
MTWIIDATSKRRLSAKLAAGLAISAFLVLGTGIGSARADDDDHRRQENHQQRSVRADDRDHRGWGRQENHEHGRWTGGYYRAPPVVYGGGYSQPGYYYSPPPPVYYGSGIGVTLPGVNFNFH